MLNKWDMLKRAVEALEKIAEELSQINERAWREAARNGYDF